MRGGYSRYPSRASIHMAACHIWHTCQGLATPDLEVQSFSIAGMSGCVSDVHDHIYSHPCVGAPTSQCPLGDKRYVLTDHCKPTLLFLQWLVVGPPPIPSSKGNQGLGMNALCLSFVNSPDIMLWKADDTVLHSAYCLFTSNLVNK